MTTHQLPIVPFVSKSKDDVAKISLFLDNRADSRHGGGQRALKRPIGALHHRTRSFRSYKLPRRLKKGSLIKQRISIKKKQTQSLDAVVRCRSERRRQLHKQLRHAPGRTIDDSEAWVANVNRHKLSSHIWHRKRFIMENRNGVMTAMRSSYHNMKTIDGYCKRKKTFIHDQSFLIPLELICGFDDFLSIFERITDSGSRTYQQWLGFKRFEAAEYCMMIHKENCFPQDAIGLVNVTVRSLSAANNRQQHKVQAWIWCDPSIVASIFRTLSGVVASVETDVPMSCRVLDNSISRIALCGDQVVDSLRRLLIKHLHVASSESVSANNLNQQAKYFAHVTRSTQRLNNVWKNGRVLAVDLNDPRCKAHRSSGGTGEELSEEAESVSLKWPKNASESLLWSRAATDGPQHSHTSQAVLTNARHQQQQTLWSVLLNQLQCAQSGQRMDFKAVTAATALPGCSHCPAATANQSTSTIPLLLIRHQHSILSPAVAKKSNSSELAGDILESVPLSSGFTLLLPSVWATDLLALATAQGAVAIGLQELQHLQRRSCVLSFPRDFLDCDAGSSYWIAEQKRLQATQQLKPKSKRQAATGLDPLVRFLNQHTKNYSERESNDSVDSRGVSVVRNRSYLKALSVPKSSLPLDHSQMLTVQQEAAQLLSRSSVENSSSRGDARAQIEPLPVLPLRTLVHVRLISVCRSLPRSGCIIVQPLEKEVAHFALARVEHKLHLTNRIGRGADGFGLAPARRRWKGVQVAASQSALESRTVLGTVTSGYERHCNFESSGAVGLCDSELLHHMMREHFELAAFPPASQLVLFHNPGSTFLRPAVLEFM